MISGTGGRADADEGAAGGADPHSSAFMNPIFQDCLAVYGSNGVVEKLQTILLYEKRVLVESAGGRPARRSAVPRHPGLDIFSVGTLAKVCENLIELEDEKELAVRDGKRTLDRRTRRSLPYGTVRGLMIVGREGACSMQDTV